MRRLDYIGILAILLLLGLRDSNDLYTQIPALDTDPTARLTEDAVLTLDLVARDDAWLVREEGAEPALKAWDVAPISRDDDPITRVPLGSFVRTRIRNATSTPLEVSGPWSLEGKPFARLVIPPDLEETAWFAAGQRGRFEYVAVQVGGTLRESRRFGGAFVVVPE